MMKKPEKQAILDAALRKDFLSFLGKCFDTVSPGDRYAPNWHLDAIAWQLGQVEAGETKRLIVSMPPRYLKSIAISVAWVAWRLGHDPSLRFLCVSYSSDLGLKHAKDCRAVMMSEWYQRIFPNTRIPRGGGGNDDFRTTKGGGRLSTSVGGTVTGRGGDVIVIDDPIKPDAAQSETTRRTVVNWYANTLSSRLNDKNNGAKLVLQTNTDRHTPDSGLVALIARAHHWHKLLVDGAHQTISDLAESEGINRWDVSRQLPLVFLAPDITQAILEGRQPVDLTITRLKRAVPLPLSWEDQRRALGFQH